MTVIKTTPKKDSHSKIALKINKIISSLDRLSFKDIWHSKTRMLLSECVKTLGEEPKQHFKIEKVGESGRNHHAYKVYVNWILKEDFYSMKEARRFIRELREDSQ